MNARHGSPLRNAALVGGLLLLGLMGGCDLISPSEPNVNFIDQFSAGLIASGPGVGYDFIENYIRGLIIPYTSNVETPNGKYVFTASSWEIGGEKRNAMVVVAPSRIIHDLPRIKQGTRLEFGAGASYPRGDGVGGLVLVHIGIRWDTVYNRFIDPAHHPEQWRWYDEQVDLSPYAEQVISVAFVADPGPAGDDTGDWFAWSSPVLKYPPVDGTSPDKGALLVRSLEIGGEKRDAILTLEGSQVTFVLPAHRVGDVLYFGAGISSISGDGAVGSIVVNCEGALDVVYRRFLNPSSRLEDRRWFDDRIDLSRYYNRPISITFSASAGPVGSVPDWFAWSTPALGYIQQY